MYDRIEARQPEDLLLSMSRRPARGVYFARVCGWGDGVGEALWAYHELARQRGVILETPLANPDERQLGYLGDVLGTAFEPDEAFLRGALARWLPRMGEAARGELARAMQGEFDVLLRQGKTQSILRNLYSKLMCWLYYRFERLVPLLGGDEPPRILCQCEGVSAHELILLKLLNGLGADILLLEPAGDGAYLKRDPESRFSQLLVSGDVPFPAGFDLKRLRAEHAARPTPVRPAAPRPAAKAVDPSSYFEKPAHSACTNAWMKTADYLELLRPAADRGADPGLFYNAFVRVRGAKDKTAYLGELHRFYQRFQETGRRLVIVDGGLVDPGQDEIEKIRRRSYRSAEEMTVDLAGNLPACASVELQRLIRQAFVKTMARAQAEEPALNRLLVWAVYLLCWIRRYHAQLFGGWREGELPCFVLMGGCRGPRDSLYPLFLSRLPADVLILAPDLSKPCALEDERLLELTGGESVPADRFPRDAGALRTSTLAANAEDDLAATLYADSGLYRDRQFSRAESLTLRTTYDELFLLWNEELKYRPGFAAAGQTATLPVLYAKISGVEGGRADAYWQRIRQLLGKDAYLAPAMPMEVVHRSNPYQSLAVKTLVGGRLRRDALRSHRQYPFGLIREALQEHILDKLQLMLDRRLIKGTFENGTEYAVVATVLNLDKALLRLLQSFDFTRGNPKLVCVCADDRGASLEDAILTTFLNLVGFDVALFVPTGYQSVERYLNDNLPVEHQAGDYLYDLKVPDFDALPQPKGRSWLGALLKRG